MSAPEALERSASTTSTGQVAPLEDANGMKQVVWQDDHGMELTHVREFEPRCAPRGPTTLFPPSPPHASRSRGLGADTPTGTLTTPPPPPEPSVPPQ